MSEQNYPQLNHPWENPYYYELSNVVKSYPTFTKKVDYDKPRTIYFKQEYEYNEFFDQLPSSPSTSRNTSNSSDDSLIVSLTRTKTTIRDIVLCNEFDAFATFTFNQNTSNSKKYGYTIHERTDVDGLKSVMQNWLKNQQKIHGKFPYLILPEYHKDRKSIHFHALFKNYPGNLKNSHHKINGRTAYNITSYQAGHSTLIKIQHHPHNLEKVANYITKYITKDMPQFNGKKRYWASKNLIRPSKYQNATLTPTQLKTFKQTYRLEEHGINLSRSPQPIHPQTYRNAVLTLGTSDTSQDYPQLARLLDPDDSTSHISTIPSPALN